MTPNGEGDLVQCIGSITLTNIATAPRKKMPTEKNIPRARKVTV